MNAYKQILVAVDLTEDSFQVARQAIKVAGKSRTDIFILHVVEFIYRVNVAYDPMFYPAFEELEKNEAELIQFSKEKMTGLIAKLEVEENIQINSDVIVGIPKTEILRLSEEEQFELIVCGSHGRSGFELLLGSTANAILHHAPCDVLAVRTKKHSK